jgi:hypothetical protein
MKRVSTAHSVRKNCDEMLSHWFRVHRLKLCNIAPSAQPSSRESTTASGLNRRLRVVRHRPLRNTDSRSSRSEGSRRAKSILRVGPEDEDICKQLLGAGIPPRSPMRRCRNGMPQLRLDKGEKIWVDDVGVGGTHSVWIARIDLQRAVFEQLDC